MLQIDELAYRSGLRNTHPCVKTVFAICMLIIAVVQQNIFIGTLILVFMGLITIKIGGVPFIKYSRYVLIPLLFILLSIAAVVIGISRAPVAEYAIGAGNIYFVTDKESIQYGGKLLVRSMSAIACMYFLSFTTPLTDIIYVMKKAHVPNMLIEIMLLIYRFIFILLETGRALAIASSSRLGYAGLKAGIRTAGNIVTTLFVVAFKRVSAMYNAMESRCYDGNFSVLTEERPANKKEILTAAITLAVFLTLTIIGNI